MKKRKITIFIVAVVLITGLGTTASAFCSHSYMDYCSENVKGVQAGSCIYGPWMSPDCEAMDNRYYTTEYCPYCNDIRSTNTHIEDQYHTYCCGHYVYTWEWDICILLHDDQI